MYPAVAGSGTPKEPFGQPKLNLFSKVGYKKLFNMFP